jgi:hypothetical protein
MHPRLGLGRVVESAGVGDNEETTVQFDDPRVGIKKFMASAGYLRVVET